MTVRAAVRLAVFFSAETAGISLWCVGCHFVLSQFMHLFVFALTGALRPHLAQVGSDALILGFMLLVSVSPVAVYRTQPEPY